LVFIFLNFPLGSLLNACDRQSRNTRNMLISLLVAIALNLILIPRYNAIGASVVVLFTNVLMFVLGMIECRKIIKYNFKANLINFLRIILATLIMGIFIIIFKNSLNIIIICCLGALLYLVLLFLLGGIKKDDIIYIINSLNLKKKKI